MTALFYAAQDRGINPESTTDHGLPVVLAVSISYFFAVMTVVLRIIARKKKGVPIGLDDWWIFGALFLCGLNLVANILSVNFGLGRHILTITNPQALAGAVLTSEILYALSTVTIKISMLYLYHRVLRRGRVLSVSITTGVFIFLYSLAQVIAFLLQCIPLQALWTQESARCINLGLMTTLIGAFNIFTDIIIIVLPIPSLWHLQMDKAVRLGLVFTFALGSTTVVFSLLRTIFVGSAAATGDASWNDVPAAMYSCLELNIGVVSACLPTLRPLFFRSRQESSQSAARSKLGEPGFELFSRPRSTAVTSKGWGNLRDDSPDDAIQILTRVSVSIADESAKRKEDTRSTFS